MNLLIIMLIMFMAPQQQTICVPVAEWSVNDGMQYGDEHVFINFVEYDGEEVVGLRWQSDIPICATVKNDWSYAWYATDHNPGVYSGTANVPEEYLNSVVWKTQREVTNTVYMPVMVRSK